MFVGSKVKAYLNEAEQAGVYSAFDCLLRDYVDGSLKKNIKKLGFSGIKVNVEWSKAFKRITVSGAHRSELNLILQVSPHEALISLSYDEEDEPSYLTPPKNAIDASYFYNEIDMQIKTLLIMHE